jgi:hypothetical protein
MTRETPEVLEALRLPELCRQVCAYAGLPPPPAAAAGHFVVRSGPEPPGLLAELLEEAFVEDEAEVLVWPADEPLGPAALGPGQVAVRPGFDAPCPAAEALRRSAQPGGGPALLFAVERRDAAGRLLGVTWAAVPEEEPPPRANFQAAVLRLDYPAGPEEVEP